MIYRLTSSTIAALALLFAPAQLEAKRPAAPGGLTVLIDVDGEVTLNGQPAGTFRAGVPKRIDVASAPAELRITTNLGEHRARYVITPGDLRSRVLNLDFATGLVASLRSADASSEAVAANPLKDLPELTDITPPSIVHQVEPVYPPELLQRRGGAQVVIECIITENGRVAIARFLSDPSLFDAAAARSVLQWRYRPALLDGKPQAVFLIARIKFMSPRGEPRSGRADRKE